MWEAPTMLGPDQTFFLNLWGFLHGAPTLPYINLTPFLKTTKQKGHLIIYIGPRGVFVLQEHDTGLCKKIYDDMFVFFRNIRLSVRIPNIQHR